LVALGGGLAFLGWKHDLHDVVADAQASPEVEEFVVDLGMVLDRLGVLVFPVLDAEGGAVDDEAVEDENVLGERARLVAEDVVDHREVLHQLQVFDLASFNFTAFQTFFFIDHLYILLEHVHHEKFCKICVDS